MSSDQYDDPRNKFRQAFKLIGEAAGEALREGITRINRARRGSSGVLTEPMRQAGAQVLRSHGMGKLLLNPDGTPASANRVELALRDIASEVFEAMREAAHGEDKKQSDEVQPDPAPTGTDQTQPNAPQQKNAGGAEETVPMPGQSF
jgi:hypothetical protein